MREARSWPIVAAKTAINAAALALAFPAALTCWVESWFSSSAEGVFGFWSHVCALLPGTPGMYLRRAFYRLTLEKCAIDFFIGFGALFFHRRVRVEDEVYVGPYAVVGCANLRKGCLIGTRANLISGSAQHELRNDGGWTPSDLSRFVQIEIGEHAWIGEAATVMADVGAGSVVAAGAVVSAAVPAAVVVAGNPARFVRAATSESPRAASPSPAKPNPAVASGYVPFIDWLKCLGMLVIVYGHVAGWAPLATLPPIMSKQFGVALFMFTIGYSLSRETRSRWRVAFYRLFEIYLFGLTLALLLSIATYVSSGRLQISNYAPLLGGVNVVFNFFPANPTTWYLGTYLHIILLWAVFAYRIRVTTTMLVAALFVEIALRALLIETAGRFVAYMLITNWSTLLLLGVWYGQRSEAAGPKRSIGAWPALFGLAGGLALWAAVAARLPFTPEFPFMKLALGGPTAGVLTVSVLTSFLYIGVTWLTFQATMTLPTPAPVRFVARNTLIIFLAHMPLYYVMEPALAAWIDSRLLRSVLLGLASLVGLGLLSEGLHRIVNTRELREKLIDLLRRPGSTTSRTG
jgi:acetyltransferase-like isoleucine patch superfamily enzyme